MLNYIWAGLVALSVVFALTSDFSDIRHDTYRNGKPLPIQLSFPKAYSASAPQQDVDVKIDPGAFGDFYNVKTKPAGTYSGLLVTNTGGSMVRFAKGADLPEPFAKIRDITGADSGELRAKVGPLVLNGNVATTSIIFEPVRFVKLQAITKAAFDMAAAAITLALSLVGVLALWSGIVKIAESAGLLYLVVKITQPVLRFLFPEIPKDHPALAMIALNLTANMLGLGNAATPLGLKAMQELQTLNPKKDTATNSMVMLLALHATAFQLTPTPTLYAVMGLQANLVYLPILVVTFASTVIAAIGAYGLGFLPWNRRTDPFVAAAAGEVANG